MISLCVYMGGSLFHLVIGIFLCFQSKNANVNKNYCLLRAYELLYLWNALSSCSTQHRLHMVEGKSVICP